MDALFFRHLAISVTVWPPELQNFANLPSLSKARSKLDKKISGGQSDGMYPILALHPFYQRPMSFTNASCAVMINDFSGLLTVPHRTVKVFSRTEPIAITLVTLTFFKSMLTVLSRFSIYGGGSSRWWWEKNALFMWLMSVSAWVIKMLKNGVCWGVNLARPNIWHNQWQYKIVTCKVWWIFTFMGERKVVVKAFVLFRTVRISLAKSMWAEVQENRICFAYSKILRLALNKAN